MRINIISQLDREQWVISLYMIGTLISIFGPVSKLIIKDIVKWLKS